MHNKIEWYQEVLTLDPGSKVFFPLARLLVEEECYEKAVKVLKLGLDKHPDYLEARLLLVEIYVKLEMEVEAKEAVAPFTRMFSNYPSFWKMWGDSVGAGNADVSGAMAFLFSALHGSPLSWSEVMAEGMKKITGLDYTSKVTPQNDIEDFCSAKFGSGEQLSREIEEVSSDAESNGDEPLNSPVVLNSLRTRTMADVLFTQGDLEGALDIYRDLFASSPEEEKETLLNIMDDITSQLNEAERLDSLKPEDEEEFIDPYIANAKTKLMNTLEILAARLEARAER